jgi:cyclophilin family peptidyl-prolyl cis-trans isomerase
MPSNKKSSKKRFVSKRKSRRTLWVAIGLLAIIIVVVSGVFVYLVSSKPQEMTGPSRVLLQTSMGNITIQLRIDKPITSGNFRTLVEQGKYDGTTFHRILNDSTQFGIEVIQGGIVSGSGSTIPDEIGSNNINFAYTIAMAKTNQPNSATSQFFINLADDSSAQFDSTYAVFGTIIDGKNVVDAIGQIPCTTNPQTGEKSVPTVTVTVLKASMLP